MLTIEQKINLIADFASDIYEGIKENEDVPTSHISFLNLNNLGVPFAIGLSNEYITLTKEGEFLIEETYLNMCSLLEIDPYLDYEDEEDFWAHEDRG